MRKDEHGRQWSEKPQVHLVCAWDSERGQVNDAYEPFEAACEAEAAEAAQDVIDECARAGAGFSCVVVALPEWTVVAEFAVRRVVSWN